MPTEKEYQAEMTLSTLYKSQLRAVPSGLSEAIKPRITVTGGTVAIYGAEIEPTGLTLANIATKMALIQDQVAIASFETIPNYLAVITDSGAPDSVVITSIAITDGSLIS